MTIRPPFTQATSAAESLNLSRIEVLDLARVGKLTAWVQPVQMSQDGREIPLVVRCGQLQQTLVGTGRKLAMPEGQYLIFDPSQPLSELKGNGWLDLSILTKENHALLESAYLMPDGVPVELNTGVVLGDGAGNFYEVACWATRRMMAFVGFMTKDIEALRAAHDAEPAPAHESIADRDARCPAPDAQSTPDDQSSDEKMKRQGLINAHVHHWPTIKDDIARAAKNGLATAKFGARGWHEAKALKWARSNGKIVESRSPTSNNLATLFTRF